MEIITILSLITGLFSRNASQVKEAGKPSGILFPHFPSHECRDPSVSPSVLSPLVILAASIHVRQLLEATAPFVQVVIILVLVWLRGIQGAQTSSFRAASFIIKHQQRVIGWGGGVTISCLQVLKKEDNRIFHWEESHTCHLRQDAFFWCVKPSVNGTTMRPSCRTPGALNTNKVNVIQTGTEDGHDILLMKR